MGVLRSQTQTQTVPSSNIQTPNSQAPNPETLNLETLSLEASNIHAPETNVSSKDKSYSRGIKSHCRCINYVTSTLGFTGANSTSDFYTWLQQDAQIEAFASFHRNTPSFLANTSSPANRFQPEKFHAKPYTEIMLSNSVSCYIMLCPELDQYDHHFLFCLDVIMNNNWIKMTEPKERYGLSAGRKRRCFAFEGKGSEEEVERLLERGLVVLFHVHYLLKSTPKSVQAVLFMKKLRNMCPDVFGAIVGAPDYKGPF